MLYRRLCRLDLSDRAEGLRTRRFESLSGTEEEMRGFFGEFKDNPQVLAAELYGGPNVAERFDRLVDLLPDVDPAALRLAVLEPRLLAALQPAPAVVPEEGDQRDREDGTVLADQTVTEDGYGLQMPEQRCPVAGPDLFG